jgi:hypothetical protein
MRLISGYFEGSIYDSLVTIPHGYYSVGNRVNGAKSFSLSAVFLFRYFEMVVLFRSYSCSVFAALCAASSAPF